MHPEAASSSSDLTSESSTDDEEYLQQVPMDKMRIVKSYRRVKTQLRSLKRKKKMLLIQEKVVKEEKSLLKNLLFRSLESTNKHVNRKHTTYTKPVETSDYKYDETDLLIQIQREEQLNKALSLENTNHNMKTEIILDESIKCHNFGDTGNRAQDVPTHNKGVMQPALDVVQTEKNIIPNANVNEASSNNTQLDKSVVKPDETKSQIDQNTDQAHMNYLQESKGNKGKKKRKCMPKQSHGKVTYKMIDVENGYYIKISKPVKIKCIYFLTCKKLLRALKPIINEFADFISPELFMYVTRKVIEKEITNLLAGKEKLKSKDIFEMFREKYPEAKDGYYVISNLVAIWRGDYNDSPDPNDPFNKLIAERDPQKLVSFKDISNSKGVWEIVKILPEETPRTNEKTKKQRVDSSVSNKTDLDDSCCESATESKDKHDIDSSFVIDNGENKQGNKEEITVPDWNHKIEQENETTNMSHMKKKLKRSNEANSENKDPYLDNVIKRLCTEVVEIPSKHAQATNEGIGIEKEVKPTMEIIETNKIHTNVKELDK